jgi:hypothetical protein
MDAALSGLPLFTPPKRQASSYPDGVPVEICDLFEQTALQVRAAGYDRFSARAIFHRLRWAENIEKGNREFKIDNCHSAPLARWFIAKHPDMRDFFELRESMA